MTVWSCDQVLHKTQRFWNVNVLPHWLTETVLVCVWVEKSCKSPSTVCVCWSSENWHGSTRDGEHEGPRHDDNGTSSSRAHGLLGAQLGLVGIGWSVWNAVKRRRGCEVVRASGGTSVRVNKRVIRQGKSDPSPMTAAALLSSISLDSVCFDVRIITNT